LIWAAVVTDEVQSFYVMNISKIKSAEITRRKNPPASLASDLFKKICHAGLLDNKNSF
jgi:uncharacterized protein (UPF0218 family)